MNAIFALIAFIAVIVVWNVLFKRNIAESMFVGFLACAAFAGSDALVVGWESLVEGMKSEVTFAALAFVFVSELLTGIGLIGRLIDILSSMLGRRRGGALYAATVGSGAFGAVAHNGAAIAATIGSIAIPWMKRSKTSGETAALVISGNAGVGATFPFSGAFFLLLAAPTVAPRLTAEQMIVPMFVVAAWTVVMRLIVAYAIVRRRGVDRMDPADVKPLGATVRAGWPSLLVLAAVAVPILATAGPTAEWVVGRIGEDAAGEIPVLFWLPIFMLVVGMIVGHRNLPRRAADWWSMLGAISPKFAIVGITMISAFAASEALSTLGLGEQLAPFIERMQGVPALVMVIVVGVIVLLVSGPLSTTATLAAVGSVAFLALTSAGVSAHLAYAAIIVWASAEGCSPPGAPPLYVAAGIAGCDPVRIFKPVIGYYLVPSFLAGIVVAMSLIWVPF
ncbi:TRAP transporter large permease subunit [Nonomuraea sp. K274]|uniref:TRAP transporter large permease subunit n=1 Tax=Nonomuraea cypriaca TaxID=1187855 RepID=A0A931EZ23_9ACTN|nr:TRAP transporter large permease subunit [Nonomuraea cypriaca]MBF8189394.1 TRAP transporter large permease subunit [Nonomuraea cypriaca]